MQGNKQVIDKLNEILTAELTAINQYFIHAKLCRHWGFGRLAAKIRDESIDEMKHADTLIERILFLEGVPNVQRYNKVNVGETVKEQFELDLQLEYEAIKRLNEAVILCRDAKDNTTREQLENILKSEEEHADWLETQLELIRNLGEQLYCSQQLH